MLPLTIFAFRCGLDESVFDLIGFVATFRSASDRKQLHVLRGCILENDNDGDNCGDGDGDDNRFDIGVVVVVDWMG